MLITLDISGLFPFDQLFNIFVELSRETTSDIPNSNNDLLSNVFSSSNIFGQLIDTLMIVVTAVGSGVAVIKRSINKKADEIAAETKKQIEEMKKESTSKIDHNEDLITETKRDLCNQITNSEVRIKDNVIDLKEDAKEIKDIVQKLDEKTDRSAESIAANRTRLDTHDLRLSNLERSMYFNSESRSFGPEFRTNKSNAS